MIMLKFFSVCTSLSTITLFLFIHAQAFSQGLDNIDPVGRFEAFWFAEMVDVELLGDVAWVAGIGGLVAIDVSDPTNPTMIDRYNPSGSPIGERYYRSAINGNIAYASGRLDGISVIANIANPLKETQRRSVYKEEGVNYEGLYLDSGFLYACRHEKGFQIFELDGDFIRSQGIYENLVNAWTVVVQAGIAYIADGAGGLKILDVSDPQSVVELSAIATTGTARDIEMIDGIAYIAVGSYGLDLIDVRDPSNPIFMSNYQSPFFATGVSVNGNKAYIAEWDIVEVVDVSNVQAPISVGWEEINLRGMSIAARDSLIYVANWLNFDVLRFGNTNEADIYIEDPFIDFGTSSVGLSTTRHISVRNTGPVDLIIESISSTEDVFTLDQNNMVIEPGGESTVNLTFTPADENRAFSVIMFSSNDPDEPIKSILVTGNSGALEIGETAPDFTLNDIDGASHTLSDYRGNVVVITFFASW